MKNNEDIMILDVCTNFLKSEGHSISEIKTFFSSVKNIDSILISIILNKYPITTNPEECGFLKIKDNQYAFYIGADYECPFEGMLKIKNNTLKIIIPDIPENYNIKNNTCYGEEFDIISGIFYDSEIKEIMSKINDYEFKYNLFECLFGINKNDFENDSDEKDARNHFIELYNNFPDEVGQYIVMKTEFGIHNPDEKIEEEIYIDNSCIAEYIRENHKQKNISL